MSDPSSEVPAKPAIIDIPKPKTSADPKHAILAAETHYHKGPLPTPEFLSRYEQVQAGLADRIVKMAEEEMLHRRAIENAVVRAQEEESRAEFSEAKRGQICALLVVLITIGGAVYLGSNGHEVTGGIVGGTVGGTVGGGKPGSTMTGGIVNGGNVTGGMVTGGKVNGGNVGTVGGIVGGTGGRVSTVRSSRSMWGGNTGRGKAPAESPRATNAPEARSPTATVRTAASRSRALRGSSEVGIRSVVAVR